MEKGEEVEQIEPASKKDLQALIDRMDNFSGGMRKIVESQNTQIQQMQKNQEALVKSISELRGQGGGQTGSTGGGTTQQQKGKEIADLVVGKLVREAVGGGKPNLIEQYLMMALRESFLMQRTIRLGMMKRMNIDDLLIGEGEGGKAPGSSS